ncbi:hypothetical protein ACVBEH_16115 [Roseateles sp. GG27B]
MAAFQQLMQLQTEMSANSFRDGLARLLPPTVLNSAADKMLWSAGQYPARVEQAVSNMRACFDLLASAQVDWFSRACDSWFEISRSASASVFRHTAGVPLADRRLSARLITFPDRRSPANSASAAPAVRHAN